MNEKHATLILPTQLFKAHPAMSKEQTIYIVEHPRYFSEFAFCKQKLIFHRATCKAYYSTLKEKKYLVEYIDHEDAKKFFDRMKKDKITHLHLVDPVDIPLEKEFEKESKKNNITIKKYQTRAFLSPMDWLQEYFGDKKGYNQEFFYRAQRKRLKILVTSKGTPVGGKWNFDSDNRKPLPEDIKIPSITSPKDNSFVQEAKKYVEKHFKDNPGSADYFGYPVTHSDAEKWFDQFLEKRLIHFGDYEDAIDPEKNILFHSVLSPLLNVGLIVPDHVLEKTLEYAKKHGISLNNLEGFVRQLIGWREFIRAVYVLSHGDQRKENFFGYTKKLPQSFWKANVAIEPLDTTIEKVLKTGYAHHIERLMILGNFMLLCGIKPDDVYTWFMELFIDAYDWVMVPNVYGMSQYADGGMMTTKPYISGSNYILNMSSYKKGSWTKIWDALFWHFVASNKTKLKNVGRMNMMISTCNKMKKEKIKNYTKIAESFLDNL